MDTRRAATPIAASPLIDLIRASVIGDDEAVAGPYGSGGSRTRTTRRRAGASRSSRTSSATRSCRCTRTRTRSRRAPASRPRASARRRGGSSSTAWAATRERHAVVFCGSGSTAAINRLVDVLNLRIPADLDDRWDLRSRIPPDQRPVVFVGPFEHHSNELPWRESIADVVTIREDRDGLHRPRPAARSSSTAYADRPLKIGSFSAASNVTGIVSNTYAISRLLHEHGALSFFDFAAAAPYVGSRWTRRTTRWPTRTRCSSAPTSSSAGPGRPGVLVARRELFPNRVPTRARRRHRPVREPVRARLPVRHRAPRGGRDAGDRRVDPRGPRVPAQGGRRRRGDPRARARLHPAGDGAAGRPTPRSRSWAAPTPSGCRSCRSSSATAGRYLHHNFVVALLNDLFGIQSRGGCSCAGPYGHRLLGIDIETSHEFEREIARGCEGIKPGWVRVNFNYFISEAVFEFLLDAVDLVASEGWRLLPDYAFEPATGLWRHRGGPPRAAGVPARRLDYDDGRMAWPSHRHHEPESRLAGYLDEARALLRAAGRWRRRSPRSTRARSGRDFEALRWFLLPEEVAAEADRAWLRRAAVPGRHRDRPRDDRGEGGADRARRAAAGPRPGRLPDRRRRRTAGRSSTRATGGRRSGVAVRAIDAGPAGRGAGDLRRGPGPDAGGGRRDGEPVRPAITWQDRRPGAGGFGLLPTMAWLAARGPGAVARAAWLLGGVGRARAVAVGRGGDRAPGARDGVGRGGAGGGGRPPGSVPAPVPFGQRLGRCGRPPPTALGLPAGIPVVAGVNDGTATMLGAGPPRAGRRGRHGRRVGRARDLRRPAGRRRPGCSSAPAPLPGRWVVGGAMAALGASVDWLRDRCSAAAGRADELLAEAGRVAPGADGLVFLPYLAGERAPLFDEAARGAFVGLTLAHGARAPRAGRARGRGVRDALASPSRWPRPAPRSASSGWPGGGAGRRLGADQGGRAGRAGRRSRSSARRRSSGAAILAAAGVGAVPDLEAGVASMTVGRAPHRARPVGARGRTTSRTRVYRALWPALAGRLARLSGRRQGPSRTAGRRQHATATHDADAQPGRGADAAAPMTYRPASDQQPAARRPAAASGSPPAVARDRRALQSRRSTRRPSRARSSPPPRRVRPEAPPGGASASLARARSWRLAAALVEVRPPLLIGAARSGCSGVFGGPQRIPTDQQPRSSTASRRRRRSPRRPAAQQAPRSTRIAQAALARLTTLGCRPPPL